MKRIIGIVTVCLLCLSFAACAKTYHGTDELIEKARQEIPVSDSDTVDIKYAGMTKVDNEKVDNKAIAWFISGNEYQAHYYLPMEIEVNGDDYKFVRTYKPMTDACSDVAVVNWNRGYAFLINNPNVATVKITLENGEVTEEIIQRDDIPCEFYTSYIPAEYTFLDAQGNEVR